MFGEGVVNDATCIVLLRAIQGLSAGPEQLTADSLLQLLSNFSQLFVLRCGAHLWLCSMPARAWVVCIWGVCVWGGR